MTGDEAVMELAHKLGEARSHMERHGYRVAFRGVAELTPAETATIETPSPDPAALAELGASALAASMASPTGNVCPNCQHPTRPSGACETCPNCGQTSSCG